MPPAPEPRAALPPSRRAVLGAAAAGLLAACTSAQDHAGPAAAPPTSSPAPGPVARPSTPAAPPPPSIDVLAAPATVIARSRVPVLCYHQIREWTSRDTAADREWIVPPATFTAHLDALVASGRRTVSPDQLVAHLTTGAPLPDRPVVLTYDDAGVDGVDVALPQMLERGFTGTYFVPTAVLGQRRHLSRDQLRELDRAGMTVAAHTRDHQRVDRYSGDDWEVQVDGPAQELARVLGHPVRYFAYPYGVWDPAAFEHLLAAGVTAAFQLDAAPMDPEHPLLTIRRTVADPSWSTTTLLQRLATGS